MPGATLTKQLKLIATLDDAALKQQIAELKRDLGAGVSLKTNDINSIKRSFEEIAESFSDKFKESIKSAIQELKSAQLADIGTARVESSSRGKKTSAIQLEKDLQEKLSDDLSKLDYERFKTREKQELDLKKQVERQEKELARQKDRQIKEEIRQKKQSAKEVAIEERRIRQTGIEAAEGYLEAGGQQRHRKGEMLRGGATALGAIGTLGMGYVEVQRTLAERRYRFAQDVLAGNQIEAIARQAGREEITPRAAGGLGGLAAGAATGAAIGSIVPLVGTGIGAAIGGVAGGIGGYFMGQARGGEAAAQQAQPLSDAYRRAAAMNNMRLAGYAGMTNIRDISGTNRLDLMMAGGARMGYQPEETMQQYMQLRPFLGTRAPFSRGRVGESDILGGAGRFAYPPTLMQNAQRMQRITGIGIEELGAAGEMFAGATSTGMRGGMNTAIEVMKKGVAAGLDISKTSQFLKASSDFVATNAGMADINLGFITDQLAKSAQAFAGKEDVTQLDIQRAAQLQQMTRQESMAKGGLAGLGNIIGVQEALGKEATPGRLLALMGMSATARPEDISSTLQETGLNKEQADIVAARVQKAKQENILRGGRAAFGEGPEGRALFMAYGAEEQGLPVESFRAGVQARERLPGMQLDLTQAEKQMKTVEEQITSTKDFEKATSEAKLATDQVTAGIKAFDASIGATKKAVDELATSLEKAKRSVDSYSAAIGIKVSK